jgi:AraC family transcriptional regulator of adaptative response / DNA-3-methyladenine glycosylase II
MNAGYAVKRVRKPRDAAGLKAQTVAMDLDHDACYRAICARDSRFDGRLFTAVLTTGIYCRPICPARTPRTENVRFFATAAAAQEAGFRPCLRCRPETAPDLGAWRGSSNTVSRALAMIEMGALDDQSVDSLAERLGVGERHLRRLFRQHLGATPVAVAQTRRVLLARQLIHETAMPMADVALAAGFGSLRRFNETFQSLYRRPPTALRRMVPANDARSGTTLLLRYKPPYEWAAMFDFLRARAIAGVEDVADGIYRRTICLQGEHGLVSVQPAKSDALAIHVQFAKLSALPNIIARLRRVFDLAADPEAVALDLTRDRLLAPLVATRPGLRMPGAWDGFELAVRAVLGQQISVSGAATLAGRLTSQFGERLRCADPILTHVFPTPDALALAGFGDLGLPHSRAKCLTALSAAALADPQFFTPRGSLDDAVAHLCALPGVGDWTAHYIAMRLFREPDAFPAADIGLLRAMADQAGLRPTPEALLQRAEAWRPWRGYAAQHLWTEEAARLRATARSRGLAPRKPAQAC